MTKVYLTSRLSLDKEDAVANSFELGLIMENKVARDVIVVDGMFPVTEPISDVGIDGGINFEVPHAGNNESGFLMMANVDGLRITQRYAKNTGILTIRYDDTVVRDETLDVTTDIANDVVNRNVAGFNLNNDVPAEMLYDVNTTVGEYDHDLIQDDNGRGVVLGFGAGHYRGGANQSSTHVDCYGARLNVDIINCQGIAFDYRDGARHYLEIKAIDCARGIVVRGSMWDPNHSFVDFHISHTKLSPFYVEGNHGIQGDGFDNAKAKISGAGHWVGKVFNYGKPIFIAGDLEELVLFVEQGSYWSATGGFNVVPRAGNHTPIIIGETAVGIKADITGDDTDPRFMANFARYGSQVSRTINWKGRIMDELQANSVVFYNPVVSNKGVKLSNTEAATLAVGLHLSSGGTANIKAIPNYQIDLTIDDLIADDISADDVVFDEVTADDLSVS